MANAKCCDRCGSYYLKNSLNFDNKTLAKIMVLNWDGYKAFEFDICDECVDKFMKFIHGKELENELKSIVGIKGEEK